MGDENNHPQNNLWSLNKSLTRRVRNPKRARLLVSICPTAFVVSPGTKILTKKIGRPTQERKIQNARLFVSNCLLCEVAFNSLPALWILQFWDRLSLNAEIFSWDEYRTKTWSLNKTRERNPKNVLEEQRRGHFKTCLSTCLLLKQIWPNKDRICFNEWSRAVWRGEKFYTFEKSAFPRCK